MHGFGAILRFSRICAKGTGETKSWNLNLSNDRICLQTLIKFENKVLKSVPTIKKLNYLCAKWSEILNSDYCKLLREMNQRVSLGLEVVQEVSGRLREREVCSVCGSGWPTSACFLWNEWLAFICGESIYYVHGERKQVQGWGAVTEAFYKSGTLQWDRDCNQKEKEQKDQKIIMEVIK